MRSFVLAYFLGILAVTSYATAPPKSVAASKAKVATPLILAENGKSAYSIVIAADAIPAEQNAARELSEYIGKVSGVILPVKTESEVDATQPQILVGQSARAKALLPKQNWDALGAEGIVIKTAGRNLVLAGGRPRGSLYAVYSFLEDTLGVRWWAPGESTVPVRKTVRIPVQNIQYKPKFETREVNVNSIIDDPHLAVHLKNNGSYTTYLPELGGTNPILYFAGTFDILLPVSKYFATHPEWYSDPDNGGKPCTAASRVPNHTSTQLCLSNEAARLELTKNAIAEIRKYPLVRMISISQNDNQYKCNCDADMAIEKREGSAAGTLLQFVNKVAADIEKEFPGYLVDTLAYQYTEKPPRFIHPAKNVVVRVCPIDADFGRPYTDKVNKEAYDNIVGWSKIAPRFAMWNYGTNFLNWTMPYPNLRMLGPNLKFFASQNVVSVFEQGDTFSGGTGDFVAFRTWVLSHLLWNPALDQTKLENEFLNGYYGTAAAPHLRAYFETLQTAFAKTNGKLRSFHLHWEFLDLQTMNALTRHFNAAQAAVAADPVFIQRLRRERLSLDLAWILRYKTLWREVESRKAAWEGPRDLKAAINAYAAGGREFKIKSTSSGTFDALITQLAARTALPVALPAFLRGKDPEDVIDKQEDDIRVFDTGASTYDVAKVDDPKASNGHAYKMDGKSNEWVLQAPLEESEAFVKNGPWRLYAVARFEAKPGAITATVAAPVISAGMYSFDTKKEVASGVTVPAELSDGEYHAIDMGLVSLHSNMLIWATPPQREGIDAVYIDRFLLIREPAAAKK